MSIDDSLTILNGALNAIEEQPRLTDEPENALDLSSRIEQSSEPTESNPQSHPDKAIIQREPVEIEFAKQNAEHTRAPTNEKVQEEVLSVQEIVEQVDPKPNDFKKIEQASIDKIHRYGSDSFVSL